MRGKGMSSRQQETTMVSGLRAAALDSDKDHSALLPSVPDRERPSAHIERRSNGFGRRAWQGHASALPARRERQNDLAPRRGGKTGLWKRGETEPVNARTIRLRRPRRLPGTDHARRREPK